MFIHNPKYVLQINQPYLPETETQYFERQVKEQAEMKKQMIRTKRVAAINNALLKIFRLIDKPVSLYDKYS
jgi:hypothetical protein